MLEKGDTTPKDWLSKSNQNRLKSVIGDSDKPSKDPNAPKRGKSAYLFYCQDVRDNVVSELGDGVKTTEITRELGRRWNEIKDNPKKVAKYNKLAEEDKARYEKAKSEYTCDTTTTKTKKQTTSRGKSAYIIFCSEHRAEVKTRLGDSAKMTDITKELSIMWNTAKANNQVSKYEELSKESKAKSCCNSQCVDVDSDVDADVDATPLPKKGLNGYKLYCLQKRPELVKSNPNSSSSEITKLLSSGWKCMTKEEKLCFA
jgi:hypothetical protein